VITKSLLHILVISILGLLIYSNTFNVPFTFDDKPNIANNPAIKNIHLLLDAAQAKAGILDPLLKPAMASRIVGYATFALNYRVHGLSVFGYHLVNIVIHLGNAVLVYFLAILLLEAATAASPDSPENGEGTSRLIAFLSALLFVSHPVQTQAVTYVVQRFASLATFFYLLSVFGYLKSRSGCKMQPYYMISLASAVLAMKTKEFSFTLPFVLGLIEIMFFKEKFFKRAVYLLPFALSILIIPLTILASNGSASSLEFGASPDIGRWDYFLTQLTVIIVYLKLLVLPISQNLDYDYPLYHSFFTPRVLASVFVLGSLISLGIFLWTVSKKEVWYARRALVAAFGIFWFFITLSAESSIVIIKDFIFEHRLYLPSIGLFIAFITLVTVLKDALGSKSNFLGRFVVPCAGVMILIYADATYARNMVWLDEITLWRDTVNKSPRKSRPRNNLAIAYYDGWILDKALEENRISLNLKPDPGVHVNIGNDYLRMKEFEKARKEFTEAAALKPAYEKAYFGSATAYFMEKRYSEALNSSEMAIRIKPNYAEAINMAGMIALAQGYRQDALKRFLLSISFKPDFSLAHNNAGNVYYQLGNYPAALLEYKEASSLDPGYLDPHLGMAKTYHDTGRLKDAVNECQIVLRLNPFRHDASKLLETVNLAAKRTMGN